MNQLGSLVNKAKKGDGDAFVKAVKQYEDVLYGVAKRLLDCDEDIADAMQEAIMKAFEKINALQSEEYFRTWVCKILINTCHEILRKNKRVICVEEVLPNKYRGNEFLKIELNDAINSLSHDYKLAVILYYLVGLNTREIGDYLKEPEGTIKSRLSRAKAILREKITVGRALLVMENNFEKKIYEVLHDNKEMPAAVRTALDNTYGK